MKGTKTLKEIIESKEAAPTSELAKLKVEEEAQEGVFAEAAQSEKSHQKTKFPINPAN